MNSIDFVGTVIVGVCVVAVDGSVVVVVNCVNIDKCTEKRFRRLNLVQAVKTAVPAELCYFLNLPNMAEQLQFTLEDTRLLLFL